MQGNEAEEVELEKNVRRLRERFYGNISIETAVHLMRKFSNNHDLLCKFIMLFKEELYDMDQDDRRSLSEDQVAMNVISKLRRDREVPAVSITDQVAQDLTTDQDLSELAKQMTLLPLTEKNLAMFNNATKKDIPHKDRQFSCQGCDKMWWRRVPERKEVSRCHSCRKKYDPVPYDKMWGFAEFYCRTCNRKFNGFAQMNCPCPCYVCNNPVLPTRILPPRRNIGPRTRNPHSCFAEDCYNRREPFISGMHCIHPKSRDKCHLSKVLYASNPHISTGSTVATCLTQGSLSHCDLEDLILDDIKEAEEEESDGNDS